jgi:hypothetical protein
MRSATTLTYNLYDKIIKNAIKISWDYPFKGLDVSSKLQSTRVSYMKY